MSLTRTFEDFAPPARFDKDPFTKAIIEEANAEDGDWTPIEEVTLDPVDADPSKPQTRNFTTDNAQLDPAWYRIIWKDASGDTSSGGAFFVPAAVSWEPTFTEIAAYIRSRTKIPGGGLANTFNAKTKPTAEQAEPLRRQAMRRVASAIGGSTPCKQELREDAGAAAAMYCAMLIEQSYYPEQTTSGGNSFKSLEALFNPALKTLATAVEQQCGEGTGGEEGGGGANLHPPAKGTFPTGPMPGGPATIW